MLFCKGTIQSSGGSSGCSLRQLTLPNVCGAPLNDDSLTLMRPILVPLEIKADIRNYSKLNYVLHFVELQELRAERLASLCYQIVSTMLFRNGTTVPFISFQHENCQALLRLGIHNRGRFR